MGKGKRLSEDETLAVYSTKVLPNMRVILDAHAKALGPNKGQRVLLDEMLAAYITIFPDRAVIAQRVLEVFNPQTAAPEHRALMERADQAKRGTTVAPAAETGQMSMNFDSSQAPSISTITYVGKPTVHLEENGRAACGLAGTVDPDSIKLQDRDAVDCKKCRYCRKKVFA